MQPLPWSHTQLIQLRLTQLTQLTLQTCQVQLQQGQTQITHYWPPLTLVTQLTLLTGRIPSQGLIRLQGQPAIQRVRRREQLM